MSDAHTAPDKARYLIHASGGSALADFLAQADGDPEITVADVIGPRGQPHTAVLELSADTAQRLQQRFRAAGDPSQQLTIEPDRPLSMFDSGAAGPM
nr:hypothetical protein [uncultured Duganella sp.]